MYYEEIEASIYEITFSDGIERQARASSFTNALIIGISNQLQVGASTEVTDLRRRKKFGGYEVYTIPPKIKLGIIINQ